VEDAKTSELLDKSINWLYCKNRDDLFIKQYKGLFNTNHNHNGEKISGKIIKPSWPPMGKYNHPL